jgi:glyoxylase-like metal-dependent hydrolase (beta-lactamase superfamily II)
MRPRDSAHYRAYCLYIRELLEALPRFEDLDRRFFHFLTDETTPRPLPEDFDAHQWHYRATAPTEVLHEGDRVDLGDRELTVLHTPGHTPDSICLLDEKSGVLFGGDTVNSGPIYAQQPDSDLNAFATSARRLAELVPMIRVVYVAHFQRYALDPGFLVEMADGFERVASGGARLRRTVDYGGSPVQEAAFQRFSILIAPVGA